MRTIPGVAIGAAVLAALVPSSASAVDVTKSKRLWATINICDTRKAPNTVGVRVSMPGSGKKTERMYARVRLQFFRPSSQSWVLLGDGADSGWIPLGKATFLRRETGWTQQLSAPAPGQQFRIRGHVRFEWRRGAAVKRKATRVTAGRIENVQGADPADYSAAQCIITAP
jgi:hypothetical protein